MMSIELGQIAEFIRGPFGGSLKKEIFVEDGIAVYEQQHAIYNQFDQIRYFIDEDKFNEMKRFEVKPDDIIMSCSGTMGKVAIVPKNIRKGIINQALLKISPSEKLSSRYLEYYMQSNIFFEFLNADAKGAAIKNVASVKELKKIPIYIGSLSEQQAIVAKLDEAFSLIDQAKANLQQNVQNAKELFQSKLNQIFSQKGDGWEEKKLGEVALNFGRGKSKHRPRNWDGLYGGIYPFIQTGDVRNSSKYILEYNQTYNEIGLAQSKLWKKNTICITIAANIAETGILDFDACFPDSIIGLEVNTSRYDIHFTYYVLQYSKIKLQELSKGFAQANINLGTFENMFFPFPKSLTTQQQIVEQLDQLSEQTNALQARYQQKLNNLEELRKSILEKAFKGELITTAILETL